MVNENINVLVVGDIMLDEYIIGTVDRISPEAPVPIVLTKDKKYCLGGCGNVANNLRSLHVNTTCLSIIGFDQEGEKIKKLINEKSIEPHIIETQNPTTTKTRIVTDSNIQMLRVDKEITQYPKYIQETISSKLEQVLRNNKFDIVIISDYNKGMITKNLLNIIEYFSHDFKILADIKPENIDLLDFNIYLIKPNEKEYLKMKNKQINSRYIINTLGKKGIKILNYDRDIVDEIKGTPVEVYNVSGAGDTVMAVLATCIGLGINIKTASKIANDCARYVIQYPDTTPIDYDFFIKSIYDNKYRES